MHKSRKTEMWQVLSSEIKTAEKNYTSILISFWEKNQDAKEREMDWRLWMLATPAGFPDLIPITHTDSLQLTIMPAPGD